MTGVQTCALPICKVIDTTMGLTPLGGFMMGTRSGSLDPSVIMPLDKVLSLSQEFCLVLFLR